MSSIKSASGSISVENYISKYSIKWEINNFSSTSQMNVGDFMVSGVFTTPGDGCLHHWQLELHPMGYEDKYRGNLSLFLLSLNAYGVEVNCKCVLLNGKGEVVEDTKAWKYKFNARGQGNGYFEFADRQLIEDKKRGVLMDDKITILCEVIATKTTKQSELVVPLTDYSQKLAVLEHFERLLDEERFSDVKIIVGGRNLRAHRAVLARSPVFAAMFEHGMKESKENEVEITDVDYEILKEMVRFIYCGKVRDIDKIAEDLFAAADKYGLDDLKIMCEKCLLHRLSVDNALELFEIADLHNAVELKEGVKKFMIVNAKDIVKKPEFKAVKHLHEDVLLEIVQALVLKEGQ